MKKLLQINICSNVLSTGKICEDIAKVAISNGWESYIGYGRMAKPGVSHEFRIGSNLETYEHYIEHRLLDREGLASRYATKRLIQTVKKIKPDIIHLHNIHDHFLNYPILFNYLASLDTPVVWTQHDCWGYTGGCVYHDLYDCEKWRDGCKGGCPNKRAIFCNKSEYQFALKHEVFSKVKNLTFVPVSDWLGDLLKQSFHKDRSIVTIHNGIDVETFKPSNVVKKVKEGAIFSILGVAAVWDARKGLPDFIKLRSLLPEEFEITLVGLTEKQINILPEGITGITRSSNLDEMVQLYRDADVFVNSTYSDNFPTTNLEALACGTPVITYRTGGSPEAIDGNTGVVVQHGDVLTLANTIMQMRNTPLSSEDCRKRAEEYFDKDKCFKQYINLYGELIGNSEG